MRTEKALELIKKYEGLSLTAYMCPAGIWTVGYGATGKGVGPNTKWTKEQAEKDLNHRLSLLDLGLEKLECDLDLHIRDNEAAAILSLIYNIGWGAFRSSTLLKLLIANDRNGAADQFLRWNKSRGKILAGLVKRREEERALFLS